LDLGSRHSKTVPARELVAENSGGVDRSELAQLAQQIRELQRELQAVRSQSAQQGRPASEPAPSGDAPQSPSQASDLETARAVAAEQFQGHLDRVAQAFADEKVDRTWANYASSRVSAALNGHVALRSVAHDLQCRSQTCRVEVEDDGTGTVSNHISALVLELADVLPTVVAQQIDRGDGRYAMVLYMSSQSSSGPGASRPQ
jgi:hypothetical protein